MLKKSIMYIEKTYNVKLETIYRATLFTIQ